MTKLVLTNVNNISGAEATAIANINANSAAIVAAVENTLSRDGTSPDQMATDLDLNSHNLLNGGRGDFLTLFINGVDVHAISGPTGPQGLPGTNGTNGALWFTGSLDPTASTADGNFYLQTGTGSTGVVGDVWMRVSGAWVKQGNIRGAQGASGAGTGDMLASVYDAANIHQQVVGTTATQTLTNKTLTAPILGTPASVTLTNATGLPISTGVSGLGTGISTFLATPSSANLAAAVTDETGTGALVLAVSPALTGTPTAPTASVGTNTTQIATTANVTASVKQYLNQSIYSSNSTLALADLGNIVYLTSSSAFTITIPLNATVAFPTNCRLDFINFNTGQVTFAGAGGVTLLSNGSAFKTNGQYTACSLIKDATDTWVLVGNIST